MSIAIVRLQSTGADGATTSAAIVPGWGANLIELSVTPDGGRPVPVLEPVDPQTLAARPTSYGMPVLAPTPGRVGKNQSGRFRYRGVSYQMRPTRHGLVRQRPWSLVSSSDSTAVCVVNVDPHDASRAPDSFPFCFQAKHRIELADRSLTSTVSLTNTGSRPQPLNVGWHPYLHRSGGVKVRIPAASRLELDAEAERTPTGELLAVDGPDDFRLGRALGADEHWDDVFTNLEYDAGRSRSWLETEEQLLQRGVPTRFRVRRFVELREPASDPDMRPVPFMQLYTPPEPGRGAISLEPLSSAPNAINLVDLPGSGVCELASGETATFEALLGLQVIEL